MSKISAVIITLNEERKHHTLPQFPSGVADEIVVVDSFSADNTPTICKQHENIRFLQLAIGEGLCQNKELGNEQATHPIFLSIDADEVLDEELRSYLN